MIRFAKYAGLILSFFVISLAHGQEDKAKLEQQKNALLREISATQKLIDETRKTQTLSLQQLNLLNKKIADRKKLIDNLNGQIGALNRSIQTSDEQINLLQYELQVLKQNYAKIIRNAYLKQNRYSDLYYLFSSQDLQQAYRRLRYLQIYNRHRRDQAGRIKEAQVKLSRKIIELQTKVAEKKTVVVQEEQQKANLSIEKLEQEQTLNKLKKDEKKLRAELEAKKRSAAKLEAAIKRAIEAELARERERARALAEKERAKTGAPKPASSPKTKDDAFVVSPETKLISNKFEANKGKLPWPVDKGVIVEGFGPHKHPVLAGVITQNNGVDFAAPKGSSIKAIFDGEVAAVVSIPGSNNAVLLRHGEYLTVYSNLTDVRVSNGQKVKAGEVLGSLASDETNQKAMGHLEIWKGKQKSNPEEWLAR